MLDGDCHLLSLSSVGEDSETFLFYFETTDHSVHSLAAYQRILHTCLYQVLLLALCSCVLDKQGNYAIRTCVLLVVVVVVMEMVM